MEQRKIVYSEYINHLVREFSAYLLEEKKLAPSTTQRYVGKIKFFYENYLIEDGVIIRKISSESIILFMGGLYLENKSAENKNNIALYLNSIKKYAAFCYDKEKLGLNTYIEIEGALSKMDLFFNQIEMDLKISFNNDLYKKRYLLEKYAQIQEKYKPFVIESKLVSLVRGDQYSQFLIIRDFAFFLNYIKENKVRVNAESKYISKKHLALLYKGFLSKEEYRKEWSQEQATLLHFFYQAALELELCTIEKGNIIATTQRVQFYEQCTVEQQYALLLDTVWNKLTWESLLPKVHNGRPYISKHLRSLYARILYGFPCDTIVDLGSEQGKNLLSFSLGWNIDVLQTAILPLLSYFGILEFEYKKNRTKEEQEDKTGIQNITVKELGKNIFSYYGKEHISLNGGDSIERAFYNAIKKRFTERKIGRNEPCPCGSTKKYKKCCNASLEI